MTRQEASDVLFLDTDTLTDYVKRYQSGDLTSVLNAAHKGSQCRLSDDQLKDYGEYLRKRYYITNILSVLTILKRRVQIFLKIKMSTTMTLYP